MLALCGFFPLAGLRFYGRWGSGYESHPDALLTPGVEASGGSLGQIPGIAVGRALAIRRNGPDHNDRMVFVVVGDGECNEGSVWEAFMAAGHFRLDHLVFLVDANKVQAKGFVNLDMSIEPLAAKLAAFNLDVHEVANGHDVGELVDLFTTLRQQRKGKPIAVILNTVKGKKVFDAQFNPNWHTSAPRSAAQAAAWLAELWEQDGRRLGIPAEFPARARGRRSRSSPRCTAIPTPCGIGRRRKPRWRSSSCRTGRATREMRYHMGFALADLARGNDRIVALDADLRSSTGLHIFEHFFPDRLVKCGIAEQNMVAMAAGFAQEGYIPFPCTFDSFSRRFMDQLYVSVAYGNLDVKFLGAYAGLFTGKAGRHPPERQGALVPPAGAEPAGDRARVHRRARAGPALRRRDPGAVLPAHRALRGRARRDCPRATGSSSAAG